MNNEGISIEEIHKEIDLIQSCITRMAQNSFMVKVNCSPSRGQ